MYNEIKIEMEIKIKIEISLEIADCFHEFFLYDLLKSTEEIINVIFVIN